MGKSHSTVPADIMELYERLVATNPSVERKGATMPYTSRNGHMFSFLTQAGTLALRLPSEEREAFLKKHKTKLCEQHGTVLKEYVEVPGALLKRTQELKHYFDLSCAYVGSLKQKPTKRKPGKKQQNVTRSGLTTGSQRGRRTN
jgi:TfoX/Sxy family transcriptional regulator of competence genes